MCLQLLCYLKDQRPHLTILRVCGTPCLPELLRYQFFINYKPYFFCFFFGYKQSTARRLQIVSLRYEVARVAIYYITYYYEFGSSAPFSSVVLSTSSCQLGHMLRIPQNCLKPYSIIDVTSIIGLTCPFTWWSASLGMRPALWASITWLICKDRSHYDLVV